MQRCHKNRFVYHTLAAQIGLFERVQFHAMCAQLHGQRLLFVLLLQSLFNITHHCLEIFHRLKEFHLQAQFIGFAQGLAQGDGRFALQPQLRLRVFPQRLVVVAQCSPARHHPLLRQKLLLLGHNVQCLAIAIAC